MVEQSQSQQHSQDNSKSKSTYAMRLKEENLMPLAKRLQRNQIYLMRAAIAGETHLQQIKLQESNSQRIGPKSEIGTNICQFASTIDAQNPTLVGNNWEYYNRSKYVEANPGDITINNFEGKKL